MNSAKRSRVESDEVFLSLGSLGEYNNHAVNSILARLEGVERGISSMQSSLAKLDADRPSTVTNQAADTAYMCSYVTSTRSKLSVRSPCRRYVQAGDNCEAYVGPTSLHCIILDLKENVLDPICVNRSRVQQAAISAQDSLDKLLESANDSESDDDDSPLAMPPMAILEAMMEPYFSLVNPNMPIWTQNAFRKLVDDFQTFGNVVKDRACAVCCNNMILLTLAAKSLRDEAKRRAQSTSKQRPASMDLDLIRPFLANAKRAVNKIEQLLTPSLVNLQAFLSLCLVAQQYLTQDICNLCFHQAAYLARFIGLDQSHLSIEDPDFEDVQRRCDLLQCMCMIGTSVSWISGVRQVYFAAEMPAILASTDIQALAVTGVNWRDRLRLAWIEDQVFALLYSHNFQSRKPDEILDSIAVLQRELDEWWNDCAPDRDVNDADVANVSSASPRREFYVEQAISFHSVRLLLSWPVSDRYGGPLAALEESRICMKLFARAWDSGTDLGRYASLSRLIVSYPPLAFIRLLMHVIDDVDGKADSSVDDDFELLRSFALMVKTVATLSDPRSHIARLDALVRPLVIFAAAAHSPTLRRPNSQMTVGGGEPPERMLQGLEAFDVSELHSRSVCSPPPLHFPFDFADAVSTDFLTAYSPGIRMEHGESSAGFLF
ncbi:hypothetical protein DL764_010769 [Monosporascus ibericus]|uniref:Transcription factor domain-containing protein n=1 Tax=Monosporascus ibericus TaxID=155417 RepID=A0A4Q4SS64_9PEZI|nr:hypothetical protein DL764_010769 [Monosporascus ibericus]